MKFPRFRGSISLGLDFKYLLKLLFLRRSKYNLQRPTEGVFEDYFQRAVGFTSSYRVGLFKCLESLQLEPGAEVLLGPITIPDAIHSILFNNLRPVFVDLDTADHIVDLNSLKQNVTKQSKVLVITYLSGLAPNFEKMNAILEFCKKHEIILIEDVTQAYGARVRGQPLGSFGRFAIGSFSAGKMVTSTYGGVISCASEDLKKIRPSLDSIFCQQPRYQLLFKHFYFFILNFVTQRVFFNLIVYPFLRITWTDESSSEKPPFLALVEELDPFNDEFLKSRRKSFPESFFFRLQNWHFSFLQDCMKQLPQVVGHRQEQARFFVSQLLPKVQKYLPRAIFNFQESVYYHFPIHCPVDRAQFRKFLFFEGVDCVGYGLNDCHREPIFLEFYRNCPTADFIKQGLVFLPFHESFSKDEMTLLAEKINHVFSHFEGSHELRSIEQSRESNLESSTQ